MRMEGESRIWGGHVDHQVRVPGHWELGRSCLPVRQGAEQLTVRPGWATHSFRDLLWSAAILESYRFLKPRHHRVSIRIVTNMKWPLPSHFSHGGHMPQAFSAEAGRAQLSPPVRVKFLPWQWRTCILQTVSGSILLLLSSRAHTAKEDLKPIFKITLFTRFSFFIAEDEKWKVRLWAQCLDVITHSKKMKQKLRSPSLLRPTPLLRSSKWTHFAFYLPIIFISLGT